MKCLSIILLFSILLSCTPSRNEIHDIACETGIPLIQLAYSMGDRTTYMEISTNESSPAREDCSTVFQAASLSKPVFAYIVLRMADRGEIDLDTPLYTYTGIEKFEDPALARKLTARMVLSHATGLPNWAASPSSPEWPGTSVSFLFTPDSAFSYSGEGYAFLQRAVEAIQGKGLEEIALAEVFIPLGMNTSSYVWRDDYDSLAVSGFTREGENRGKGNFPRANSAYTLRTTAPDYMKFLQALSRGTGLGKKSREEMFHPRVKAARYAQRRRDCDEYIFWGLGLGIEKHPELGEVAFHWGDNGTFKSLFLMVPQTGHSPQRILVYFTNSEKGHDVINRISSLFLKNTTTLTIQNWVLE